MGESVVLSVQAARWGRWRELAGVLAGLKQLDGRWSDPATLRRGIELAIRLGELLGAEPEWIARLKSVLENERLWEVVRSLVAWVTSWGDEGETAESGTVVAWSEPSATTVEAQSLAVWLPVVLELVALWRSLRRRGS